MTVEGVDLDALGRWLDEVDGDGRTGRGPLLAVEALAGGTQNVLLRFERAGAAGPMVLRRPPLHPRPNSDETMRREARVLAALAGSDVPHPTLLVACPTVDVLGVAFYVMAEVDGANPTVDLPDAIRTSPDEQRRLGFAMADALLALAAVEPAAVGLEDLGRPEGWIERQVDRWRSQLAGYEQASGAAVDIGPVAEVAAWLDERRPRTWRPGLLHGDFHFANVLVRRDRGQLAAVVDWELATIGDPLLDLGHLLATWPLADQASSVSVPAPHLPSPAEVVERYAERTDRDLGDLPWFQVLACYRLAVILEGTHVRAGLGKAPVEVGERLHRLATALVEQARRIVSR